MKFNDKITKEITFKQVELGNKGLEASWDALEKARSAIYENLQKKKNIQCNKELIQMTDDYNDIKGSVEELNVAKEKINQLQRSLKKVNKELETKETNIRNTYAQNNKLQKEIDRSRKTREECQKQLQICEKQLIFQNAWPDRIELLLELLVWPYAAWNKKSILHTFLRKRNEVNATSRFVLTSGVTCLWLVTIAWLTSSLWRPYLYILEENRSDSKSSSSSKNTIKKPKANLKSILGLNRGGAQVLIHPGDLAFLEIHAIKTKRKLDGQVFQYGTKNAKFKVKKIVQKIKNNRVVISVYTVATFYFAALADNQKIGIPNGGRTPSTPRQSFAFLSFN